MRTVASENQSQGTRGRGRPGARSAALRKSRLRGMVLEALESRTLLATLPAATVNGQVQVSASQGNESAPTVAIDPNIPLDMVSVWTRNDPAHTINNGQTAVFIEGAFSSDAGLTWTPLAGTLG